MMPTRKKECGRILMRVPVTFKTLIDIWASAAGMNSTDYIESVIMPTWKKVV